VGILIWLIPALACNFPVAESRTSSLGDLRHTMTAVAPGDRESQTSLPDQGGTPKPRPSGGSLVVIPPPGFDQGGNEQVVIYLAQSGDTLPVVAKRFGVEPDQITSPQPLSAEDLLSPGQELVIPNLIGETPYPGMLLPDNVIVSSPTTVGFQIDEFIHSAGGYLSTYSEPVNGERLSGADIVVKVAEENSINPRLLLAILEYRSGWVFGQPANPSLVDHPIGFYVPDYVGLYYELVLTATHLGVGYYGWRTGNLTMLVFLDGSIVRISPTLNPGSVALQVLFSKLYNREDWRKTLYDEDGFISRYTQIYPDPWAEAEEAQPLFPSGISQPRLEFPFVPGERWSFTGGPHRSWNSGSPYGALDFSPVTGEAPCTTSRAWVTASAAGRVTRSSDSVVAIDLDGDGYEQTGWVLVYLHVAGQDSISPGSWVEVDEPLGHPSCERGKSTGTHVHLARKYNGEWIPAGDPLRFVLSGYEVQAGDRSYQGKLVKGDEIISANPGGPSTSIIIRDE
jgi:LasA protease